MNESFSSCYNCNIMQHRTIIELWKSVDDCNILHVLATLFHYKSQLPSLGTFNHRHEASRLLSNFDKFCFVQRRFCYSFKAGFWLLALLQSWSSRCVLLRLCKRQQLEGFDENRVQVFLIHRHFFAEVRLEHFESCNETFIPSTRNYLWRDLQ